MEERTEWKEKKMAKKVTKECETKRNGRQEERKGGERGKDEIKRK